MSYKRKTQDEFQIHGNYAGKYEEVTAYGTWREARIGANEHRSNEPGVSFLIKKARVKIAA